MDDEIMRTIGLISAGVAVLGLLAYFFLGDLLPVFVVPLILISGNLAIICILVSIVINKTSSGKKYRCVNCGTILTGGNPIRYGNVCPNCGGNVFA
jgi:DNA-directed RNA polymerase subunit RPC12/RpoP